MEWLTEFAATGGPRASHQRDSAALATRAMWFSFWQAQASTIQAIPSGCTMRGFGRGRDRDMTTTF